MLKATKISSKTTTRNLTITLILHSKDQVRQSSRGYYDTLDSPDRIFSCILAAFLLLTLRKIYSDGLYDIEMLSRYDANRRITQCPWQLPHHHIIMSPSPKWRHWATDLAVSHADVSRISISHKEGWIFSWMHRGKADNKGTFCQERYSWGTKRLMNESNVCIIFCTLYSRSINHMLARRWHMDRAKYFRWGEWDIKELGLRLNASMLGYLWMETRHMQLIANQTYKTV